MFKALIAASSLTAIGPADISAYVEQVYEGYLTESPDTYVLSYDLMVEVTGDDVWAAAGG